MYKLLRFINENKSDKIDLGLSSKPHYPMFLFLLNCIKKGYRNIFF